MRAKAKRIVFSEQAKADIRAIPRQIAMNVLAAIHRLADTGVGDVKTLKSRASEKRLRVGDYRVRFTEEKPESGARTELKTTRAPSASTRSGAAKTPIADHAENR